MHNLNIGQVLVLAVAVWLIYVTIELADYINAWPF